MKELEVIKKEYIENYMISNNYPRKEEKEYYKITDDILKQWRTDDSLKFKRYFYKNLSEFNDSENETEKKFLIKNVYYYFTEACNDHDADDSYYYGISAILKDAYENDIFDLVTYDDRYADYLANLKGPLPPFCFPIVLYEGRKYIGVVPNLWYSNHLDVFDDVLKYFANVIYQKYGLFLQKVMNILIDFCKEYSLPYVDLLEKAKKDAKELYYPSNHEFKYQFSHRLNVKWDE